VTERRDIRADLEPDTPDEVVRLAERLEHERPVPSAAFRGGLRRRLMAGDGKRPRPARLKMIITGYASAGSVLLLIGALSAAGTGPLGA
jgi:hypothetical protein